MLDRHPPRVPSPFLEAQTREPPRQEEGWMLRWLFGFPAVWLCKPMAAPTDWVLELCAVMGHWLRCLDILLPRAVRCLPRFF